MYEFTEDCMLHIDAIDEEHKRLFQMINEAFELVEKTEDVTAIGQSLIANLKDYAATHLAHEEAYMESIHDPELPLRRQNTLHLQRRSMNLNWIPHHHAMPRDR